MTTRLPVPEVVRTQDNPLGGILVVWVDVAARMLIAPEELPVGVLTAVIGGPIFIWMLKKSYRR